MSPNRLIHEHSPYLLQHAHNPVDWYPWGDEAFAKAKREHKPVFLSIGYATCHWCHVMARESFEDDQVARLLNEAFVCVKVDRQERPDVDSVYMAVCQLTSGSGGWPLTVLLTPDKRAFFAGTYFPKRTRGNRIGMLELVPRLKAAWENRAQEVLASADQIANALQQSASSSGGQTLDESALHAAYRELCARFDPVCGGFGTRPKFPTAHQLTFLLRYWHRSGEAHALHIVEHTLQQMRRGGVFDQVGFGFHRYATDAQWLLPHFEKMLYDQALLVLAYVEAFQATGNPDYRQVAQQVIEYVLRDLTSPEGAFYSAEDADSEGEEGKYYVWRVAQLAHALNPQELALAIEAFGVLEGGNFFEEASGQKTGFNVLHLKHPLPELAHTLALTPQTLASRLEDIRQKLFDARRQRPRPLLDEMVLADWNGLMVAALAKAAHAFDEPRYAQAAERAVAFLQTRLWAQGRLLHRYRQGHAAIDGYLNDYAFVIWGALNLYEATFNPAHLAWAQALTQVVFEDFWDDDCGGCFFTANHAEPLPVRQKELYDGAIPSGNSVVLSNLLRLSLMTGDLSLEEAAWRLMGAASERVAQSPSLFTQLLQGVALALGSAHTVVLAGSLKHTLRHPLMRALRRSFQPNAAILVRDPQQAAALDSLAPFAAHSLPIDGQPAAYVCQRHACQQPTQSPAALLEALRV